MSTPTVTVVVPVYDRQEELRRALRSLEEQSFEDFQCLVVDDCSSVPIEPVVADLGDDRFAYLRTESNRGPSGARMLGYRHMEGQYLFHLDSDDEAFPWTLMQAVGYLDRTPEAAAVAGLHLRDEENTLSVRVTGGTRLVTPSEFQTQPPVPDCVGMVRRSVVDEWLEKREDYFALEAHQWITFGLRHNQLYVDEPWIRCHVRGTDRISQSSSDRMLADYRKFVEEHDDVLRTTPSAGIDDLLFRAWVQLTRARRVSDANVVRDYLRLRGIPYRRMLLRYGASRFISKAGFALGRHDPPYYL